MIILCLLQARIAEEASNLPIINTQASVLSNLRRAGGVNDTHFWTNDDIRDSRVRQGLTIPEICGSLARDNVINLELIAFTVQIIDGCISVCVVCEEDESDIVCGDEIDGHEQWQD